MAIIGKLSWSIFARVVAVPIALASQILLVRVLGEEAFGEYVAFTVTVSLIAMFCKGGIDSIVTRRAARNFSIGNVFKQFELLEAAHKILLVSTIATVILAFAFDRLISYYDAGWTKTNPLKAGLLGLSAFLLCTSSILAGYLRGIGHFVYADFSEQLGRPVITAVVVATAAVIWGKVIGSTSLQVLLIGAAYCLVQALLSAILLLGCLRSGGSKPQLETVSKQFIDAARTNEHVNSLPGAISIYSPKLLVVAICSFSLFQFDTFLLARFSDATAVGAYNVSCSYVRAVIFIPMLLASSYQSKIASAWALEEYAQTNRIYLRLLAFALATSILSACAISLFSKNLIEISSPLFGDYANTLSILAFAHVCNSILIVSGMALTMTLNEHKTMIAMLAGAATAILGYTITIPLYGPAGAAASAGLGMAVAATTSTTFAIRALARKAS